jgi:hypothetical protein
MTSQSWTDPAGASSGERTELSTWAVGVVSSPTWIKLGGLGLGALGLLFVGWLLFCRRGNWHESGRPHGFGRIVATGLVALVGLGFLWWMQADSLSGSVRSRQLVNRARQQAEQSQRRVREAQQRANSRFDKAIDDFEKPRIALNSAEAVPADSGSTMSAEAPAAAKQATVAEMVHISDAHAADEGQTAEAAAKVETRDDKAHSQTGGHSHEGGDSHDDRPGAEATSPQSAMSPGAAIRPTTVFRIHFDQNRLREYSVPFGDAVAVFMSQRPDQNSPVNIDADKMLIEFDASSPNASRFGQMMMRTKVYGNIRLSQLTDKISTEKAWSQSQKTPAGTPRSPATGRPSWADDTPQRSGDVWRQVIVTGDFSTPEECYNRADLQLMLATWIHLQSLIRPTAEIGVQEQAFLASPENAEWASRFENFWPTYQINDLATMGIGWDYIRREIVRPGEEYLETIERPNSTLGPMKRMYTRLSFTPQVDAHLTARWREREQSGRIFNVAMTSGVTVFGLFLLYGLLKIDTWTRGYYTKRLFVGVPAVIAAAVLVMMLITG